MEEVRTLSYPSLSERAQAIFIDGLVITIAMFVIAAFLHDDAADWVRIVLFLGIWAVYEPLSNSMFGCTLGGYFKNLRVRDFQDEEERINLLQSYIRYVLKLGLGWLSFITIHFNEEKKAVHDLVSGSVMTKIES